MGEVELASQAAKGDVGAFSQLIVDYQKKVYNIAYRMTGNPDDASELAQEAFIRMFHGIASFRGDCKFSTWVHKITVNVCLDEIKKRKKQSKFETYGDNDEIIHQIKDNSLSLEEQALLKERKKELQLALDKLSTEHRSVIILRDIQGHAYSEISKMMSLPEGTVKSRINRARLILANLLRKSELFDQKEVK